MVIKIVFQIKIPIIEKTLNFNKFCLNEPAIKEIYVRQIGINLPTETEIIEYLLKKLSE